MAKKDETPRGVVLVVDDDAAVAKVLSALLRQAGFDALTARSGGEALGLLAERMIDLVITDLRMPEMDGLELLRRITVSSWDVPVIVLTAHASIPKAVEAMRAGAHDFLSKPFDREEIVFTVTKALAAARHRQERVGDATASSRLIGASPVMEEVQRLISRAATSMATVLVRGESGSGKELVARAIHEESPRRSRPFTAIHCGALPDALLESELFGYEKGAFTGAIAPKPGRVELAQGGTLFLDEIGDITPALQVKLLRFLQERRFERLGSTTSVEADVRFIAATHRDLEGMVKAGEFRADLYYRLSVVPIVVPPLRARPDDVELLVRNFLGAAGAANGRPRIAIEPTAMARLGSESWPGNVRQLQNFVERLVVLSDGATLDLADVEREIARDLALAGPTPAPSGIDLADSRRAAERTAIKEALDRAHNNRTVAARLLGVSRRTLYNKLEELGLC